MDNIKRIGILTSGGDCCGLNAVLESVVRTATIKGCEVLGFKRGYYGLYTNDYVVLTDELVYNILGKGGSILGNSNKVNLFNYREEDKNGNVTYSNVSPVAIENMKKDKIDALIIVGGDGSITSARDFMRAGIKVVCVPKTIDNDVPYTDQTFGYSSAVSQIVHALNSVRTTAFSHDRIMVLEVMGRHAGWLALEGGLAGNADVILIPEIPYDIEKVAEDLISRYKKGQTGAVVCVSEGAKSKTGEVVKREDNKYPDSVKLGGIGERIAKELEALILPVTSQEVRSTNLGYIQRGGETDCYDKVLSFRYGSYAVEALNKGEYGKMVSLRGEELTLIPITDVVGNGPIGETSKGGAKNVSLDSDLLRTARSIGIEFGD